MSNDLINKLVFFGPFVLAVVPAFMPTWRWYLAAAILFIGAASIFISVVREEVSLLTSGEGPQLLGIVIYMWLAGILFLVATACRLTVYFVLRYTRRRLQRKVAQEETRT